MGQQTMSLDNQDSIPFSVRQFLTKHKIEVVGCSPNKQKNVVVEVVFLGDDKGKVQIFFPSNYLLDLTKVKQQTGRDLAPISLTDAKKIRAKLGVENIPALASFSGLTTYIDKSLLALDDYYIHSGGNDVIRLAKGFNINQNDSAQTISACAEVPFNNIEYELTLFDHDRDQINQAVENFTAKRIRQRLEETLEIPPLPETAQAIMRLRVDPNADINKLSRLVETDPSLAAQVVSWASSSYYAAPGSVKSVQDAIVRVLGYDLVMNLSLGLALGKTLDLPSDGPEGVTPYWTESVYTAATIGNLLNLIPREFRPSFGLAYLGGLLHNFGYLILAHTFRPQFSNDCRLIEANRHLESCHVDQYLLGITREQMCAGLMKAWNMPEEVYLALRYQNEPNYLGPHSDYAQLIYLSTRLLRQFDIVAGPKVDIDPAVYESLHIDPNDVAQAMESIIEARGELDSIAKGLQQV